MSKSQKTQKTHKTQKINDIVLNSDSDNEIELKPLSKTEIQPTTIIVKPKRVISEEHKEKLRERLANARTKKAEQKAELNKIQSEFLKSKEIELNEKILNNVKKINKKQEKEYLKKMMINENEKHQKIKAKTKPIVIFEEDSSHSESSSEEEPIIIKKKPVKKQAVKKFNHPPPDEPIIVQPQNYYQRPSFSIH
jgi:hypothetical protein